MIKIKGDDNNVNIRKKGNVYQYGFEVGKVNGKRKQITKSGFRTKNEAFAAGQKAYNEFINDGIKQEYEMFYSDYLDYLMKEYFQINYKYSSARRNKETFGIIKQERRTCTCNSRPFFSYFFVNSIIRLELLFYIEMFHINCNSTLNFP